MPSYAMHVNADLLLPLNALLCAADIDLGNYMGIPEQFLVDSNLYALPFRSDFWVVSTTRTCLTRPKSSWP